MTVLLQQLKVAEVNRAYTNWRSAEYSCSHGILVFGAISALEPKLCFGFGVVLSCPSCLHRSRSC